MSQYLALLYICSASIFVVLALCCRRFLSAPVALPLMLLLLAGAGWAACDALVFLSTTELDKIFWFRAKFVTGSLVTPLMLVLAIRHSKQAAWWDWRALGLLAIPLITAFLSVTGNPLFRVSVHFDMAMPYMLPQIQNGPWFYVYAIYTYVLAGFSFAALASSLHDSKRLFQRQTIAILLLFILPSSVDILSLLRVIPFYDPTPMAFTVSGVVLTWSLFRYRMLELTPIARDLALEHMTDLMFVIDDKFRLVDFNLTAEDKLGIVQQGTIGSHIATVTTRWPGLAEQLKGMAGDSREFNLDADHEGKVYCVTVSLIKGDNGEVAGKLVLLHDVTERSRSEVIMREANAQLSLQLDEIKHLQAELREQAMRDSLTGLFNRRYMDEALRVEMEKADREGYPVSVVLADIDHFKSLNDSYGHEVGDRVLQGVGAYLLQHSRIGDIACRYGGEEFLIIMPRVSRSVAQRRAEEWCAGCEDIVHKHGDMSLSATMSVGVSTYYGRSQTGDTIIKMADDALYSAKRAGRNRVVAA